METHPKGLKSAAEIDINSCVAKMIFPRTSQAQHATMKVGVACDEADAHYTYI